MNDTKPPSPPIRYWEFAEGTKKSFQSVNAFMQLLLQVIEEREMFMIR